MSETSRTGADAAREIAAEERATERGPVPDRHDTGGGPSVGVTPDGRTGPGETGNEDGPNSTLRTTDDRGASGELLNRLAEEQEK